MIMSLICLFIHLFIHPFIYLFTLPFAIAKENTIIQNLFLGSYRLPLKPKTNQTLNSCGVRAGSETWKYSSQVTVPLGYLKWIYYNHQP